MTNSLTLAGHVGQNPEAVIFDGDKKVVKFSLAVKEFSAKEDEEAKTFWVDVEAWNGMGDRVLKLVTKGREVVLCGRLAISTYNSTSNGTPRVVTKPILKLSSIYMTGKETKEFKEAKAKAKAK